MIPRTLAAFRLGRITLSLGFTRQPLPAERTKARIEAAHRAGWMDGYECGLRDGLATPAMPPHCECDLDNIVRLRDLAAT